MTKVLVFAVIMILGTTSSLVFAGLVNAQAVLEWIMRGFYLGFGLFLTIIVFAFMLKGDGENQDG